MKHIIFLCCFLFAAINLNAQNKLIIHAGGGGGSSTPQQLSFNDANNELSITDGNTVDLSAVDTNTDDQTLAFDGTNLSIVDGNSVDLSSLSGGSSMNVAYNTADGTTTLTTSAPVNANIIAIDANGQGLNTTLWSSTNNVITFSSPPPPNGAEIRVWYTTN